MQVTPTELKEVLVVTPALWRDERGFFLEAFNERAYDRHGLPTHFVQDNHSRSKRGVLRGLHYQLERPQGKLVSVVRGQILDVAVDVRRGSPTFGRWIARLLDDNERKALWIPPGFAHGFSVLSEEADVIYKCTDYYDAASERGIAWNDKSLAIDWQLAAPLISAKDSRNPILSLDRTDLPKYEATS